MNHQPRILGIIPARAGSKGIKDKNIRLLAGKPLIYYTIQSALLSRRLATILVSTDSREIVQVCRHFPILEIPFIRPPELALDTTPTIDVVRHAIDYYEQNGKTFDYVCLLQPTSPFREKDLIDKAISKMIESKADSLTTVCQVPTRYNPHWTFKMEDDLLSVSTGDTNLISRRQDLPDAWYRDGKVYVSSVALVRSGALLGGRMVGYVNSDETDVNIDTLEEWELAEKLMADEHSR
jgi:CMP-N,N'-diacetyllegionaminic acid synthase